MGYRPPEKKTNLWPIIGAVFLAGVLVLGTGLAAWFTVEKRTRGKRLTMAQIQRAIPPDMRPRTVDFKSPQNGYPIALRAVLTKKLSTVNLKKLDGDVDAMVKVIIEYKQPLNLMKQATDSPEFWETPKWGFAARFPEYTGFKNCTRALILRARVELDNRMPSRAVNDLVLAQKLGVRLRNAETTEVGWLLGVSCERVAMHDMRRLIWHPLMDRASLMKLRDEMLSDGDAKESMTEALKCDLYRGTAYAIGQNDYGLPPASRPWKGISADEKAAIDLVSKNPNPLDRWDSIRSYSAYVQKFCDRVNGPWVAHLPDPLPADLLKGWPTRPWKAYDDDLTDFPTFSKLSAHDMELGKDTLAHVKNPYGNLLFYLLRFSWDTLTAVPFSLECEHQVTKDLIAIRLYAMDHAGQLPKDYKFGTDPFSGKPLQADFKRNRVWSVGLNGVDDGGTGPVSAKDKDKDLIWEIRPSR